MQLQRPSALQYSATRMSHSPDKQSQMSTRGKGCRTRSSYSPSTLDVFHSVFAINGYPSQQERKRLADLTGETPIRVASWFKYKRARAHKRNEEIPNPCNVPISGSAPKRQPCTEVQQMLDCYSSNDSPVITDVCLGVSIHPGASEKVIANDFEDVASAVPRQSVSENDTDYTPIHVHHESDIAQDVSSYPSDQITSVPVASIDPIQRAETAYMPTYVPQTTDANPFLRTAGGSPFYSYVPHAYSFQNVYQNQYMMPPAAYYGSFPYGVPGSFLPEQYSPLNLTCSAHNYLPDINNNYRIQYLRPPIFEDNLVSMAPVQRLSHHSSSASTSASSSASASPRSELFKPNLPSPLSSSSSNASLPSTSIVSHSIENVLAADSSKIQLTAPFSQPSRSNFQPLSTTSEKYVQPSDVFPVSISPIEDHGLKDVRSSVTYLNSPEVAYKSKHTSNFLPSVHDYTGTKEDDKSSGGSVPSEFVWWR